MSPTLTDRQMQTLRAVCDTFIPSLARPDDPHGFWTRAASDVELPTHVLTVIALQPLEQQAQFRQLLDLLGSPLAALSPSGPFKPFDQMSRDEREALLVRWQFSPLGMLRQGFQGLKRVICFLFYGLSDEAGNPTWPAIGYPGPLSPPPRTERPIRPLTLSSATTLDCDTVVVGSGAGGGVVAGELSAAGQDVIVVEKGPYVAEDGFTQREAEMMGALYEAGGTLATKDLGVAVLAGSCLGGGTTVNWAASFRTPDYVLEEWAREHLLPHVLTPAYQRSFAAVEATTHVDTHESPCNPQNQALWDGAAARGAHIKSIPRNVRDCDFQTCGYCGFGCQHGAKQGTLKSYLQQAHEAGARILVNTTVERVLVEQGKAVGIQAVQRGADGTFHAVTIRAKRVVVAAGSIHTPALLRRSGLRHPHIGRHLHFHPTVAVSGIYDRPMNGWWGAIMTAVSDEWARLDGAYGFKLETPPIHPGMAALALPWHSGEQHKEGMQQVARFGSFIVLVRDRDGGQVTVDKRGQPVLHYQLSAYDRNHLCRGITEAVRTHQAAGAKSVIFPHYRFRDPLSCEEPSGLERALGEIAGWGWKTNQFPLFTAHQMGTCRMGGDAERHPLTPAAETREVHNLFVTDGSALPSASGANPMLSIQALAHYAAQDMK
ncbi:MAG: FAD-dependent oxidoreductase [Ardenticatenales bacterium]|nr:FAD-dependent oxidoreductase [Ardenticatenales bacterium]